MWLTIAIHTARRDDGNASCPYVVRGLLFSWLTFFFTEKKTEWRSWRERRRTGLGYSGLRCSLRIRTLPVAVSLSPPCLARQAARNRLSDLWKTTAIRTVHESSFPLTSPFCRISLTWKNRPEEWAAAILSAAGFIVSSLQSRNAILGPEFLFSRCLSQSFHPPICSWRKREGTCQCPSAPGFPASKELVPQLLQWSCDQCQHRQHISVGGFRVSLPI